MDTLRHVAAGQLREQLLAQLRHYIGKAVHSRPARRAEVGRKELDALNGKRGRGRPRDEWLRDISGFSNNQLADAILPECLWPWLSENGELPSAVTVADGIARRLGILRARSVNKAGMALLRIAVAAEIVEEVKPPKHDKNREPIRIRLTAHVANLLIDRLAAVDDVLPVQPSEGLRAQQPDDPPSVTPGSEQRIAPFTPLPGTSPWDAAVRIANTRWRVNDQMVAIAGRVLQEQVTETRKTCSERATWYAHGSDIKAWEQARNGLKSGYLAVRWDHRGRLNQVNSALTYTGGADLARGVLEFDEAKRVRTDAGRAALARHVLNQWSGEESRKVPNGGETAWLEARPEIPWERAAHPLRCLAAIEAWNAAERGEAIRAPISIDATTSVLQHMALLLRDPNLARLSNLWPGDRQDFYGIVGAECNMPRDAVKKVAMPTFYGQQDYTAAMVLTEKGGVPDGANPRAIADNIRAVARAVAPGAFTLHESLQAVADELTARGEPIRWSTPSGWQCTTDKRRPDRKRHEMELADGARIRWTELTAGERLDGKKQRNAITANLIQSLDASLLHMAVAGLPEGVTSIAVAHDCFAVHADDVAALRATLMQTLGQMYAADLLGGWWAAWGTTVAVPKRGPWDRRFLEGAYAFS